MGDGSYLENLTKSRVYFLIRIDTTDKYDLFLFNVQKCNIISAQAYLVTEIDKPMKESQWKIKLEPESPVEVTGDDPFKNDFLNYKDSVVNLCELIEQITPPFTLGVYGEWGSGKTSFMKMLEAQMKVSACFETFWFDAWEYENEASLLLPLLSRLAKTTKRQKSAFNSLRRVATGVLLAGTDALVKKSTAGLLSLKGIQENYELYEKEVSDYYERWIDEIDKLKRDFSKVVGKIAGDKKALVIFIDDLDRCLPENVVKLIENIKHFLSIRGNRCIFILGVDKHVLEKGIEARYGTNLISGNEYLRKIINLSFDVPACDETDDNFIIETAKRYAQPDWYMQNQDKIKKFATDFLKLGISNPRIIKPILLRYLIFLVKPESRQYTPEVIIKLLVYREVFPDAYEMKHSKNDVLFMSEYGSGGIQLAREEIVAKSCSDFGEIIINSKYKFLNGFSGDIRKKFHAMPTENLRYFKMIDFLYSLS